MFPLPKWTNNPAAPFIARTYNHLFGAICSFVILELVFFKTGLADSMAQAMLGTNWLFVLGGFVVVSWVARAGAYRATSLACPRRRPHRLCRGRGHHLCAFVVHCRSLRPRSHRLCWSHHVSGLFRIDGHRVRHPQSGAIFSFLRGILDGAASSLSRSLSAASFSASNSAPSSPSAMVALAGASILYDTSNVVYRYPQDRYGRGVFGTVCLRRPLCSGMSCAW